LTQRRKIALVSCSCWNQCTAPVLKSCRLCQKFLLLTTKLPLPVPSVKAKRTMMI
jgi:hypothetical protein